MLMFYKEKKENKENKSFDIDTVRSDFKIKFGVFLTCKDTIQQKMNPTQTIYFMWPYF